MEWCKKHLNWTWTISYILFLLVYLCMVQPNSLPDPLPLITVLIVEVIALIVGLWVLKQKNRSLWWILLQNIGSPLWLSNKSPKSNPV